MRTPELRSETLATKLQYGVPSIKLCLVHEGLTPQKLYAIQAPEDAEEYMEPLRHASEEHFVSLHLNAKHEVIGVHEVSHGTLAASLVHPREVFKAALLANSYALVACHNHPSGSLVVPSSEDIDTTKQLIRAGKLLGINLIDHLIFSPNQSVYSLREHHPEIWKV